MSAFRCPNTHVRVEKIYIAVTSRVKDISSKRQDLDISLVNSQSQQNLAYNVAFCHLQTDFQVHTVMRADSVRC